MFYHVFYSPEGYAPLVTHPGVVVDAESPTRAAQARADTLAFHPDQDDYDYEGESLYVLGHATISDWVRNPSRDPEERVYSEVHRFTLYPGHGRWSVVQA